MRQYYPYIARLVQSIVHDAAEAEDIAQETFITALLADSHSYEGNINHKGWLSKIAVNKARDLLRRRKVRDRWQQLWRGEWRGQTNGRLPEDVASQNETSQQLWRAVESLNEKHRLPVILRYGHQLPIKEIAAILEIKEGTVHSRLHHAHRQLARMLSLDVETVLLLQGGVL